MNVVLRDISELIMKQRIREVVANESVEEPEGLVGAACGALYVSIIINASCAVPTHLTRLIYNNELMSERERVCSRGCQ